MPVLEIIVEYVTSLQNLQQNCNQIEPNFWSLLDDESPQWMHGLAKSYSTVVH